MRNFQCSAYFKSALCVHLPDHIEFLPNSIGITKRIEISMPETSKVDGQDHLRIAVSILAWAVKGIYESHHSEYHFCEPQFVYKPGNREKKGTVSVIVDMKLKDKSNGKET